jgi:hypothetical protein
MLTKNDLKEIGKLIKNEVKPIIQREIKPFREEFANFTVVVKKEFDRVNERFEQVDKRFIGIDKRLDRIDIRLEDIEDDLRIVKKMQLSDSDQTAKNTDSLRIIKTKLKMG